MKLFSFNAVTTAPGYGLAVRLSYCYS